MDVAFCTHGLGFFNLFLKYIIDHTQGFGESNKMIKWRYRSEKNYTQRRLWADMGLVVDKKQQWMWK